MSEKILYRCNICYLRKGLLLNSCGCFYCNECFRDTKSYINIEKATCFSCQKAIDFKKTIDVTNKDSVKKVEFIYDEPEVHLKKVLEMIKFQNLHKKKYIDYLEQQVDRLTKENKKLRDTLKSGNSELKNRNSLGKGNMSSSIPMNNSSNEPVNSLNSNQFLDLKQIKKIEPKRPDKNSNKSNPKNDHIKIDNLNAKTAEIMKTSPAIGNNLNPHLNIQNSNKALINVNINNSSRNFPKDAQTNYEKSLFNKSAGLAVNNSNTNANRSNENPHNPQNIYYHNQKRKYLQMINYDKVMGLNNQNMNMNNNVPANYGNFQTPLPYPQNNADFPTKKFKYY